MRHQNQRIKILYRNFLLKINKINIFTKLKGKL